MNRDNIGTVVQNADILIFYAPRDGYSLEELALLRTFLAHGGSVLVFMSEGGDPKKAGSINSLLTEFGITVQSDQVIRTCFKKYHHPRECLIPNGVLIDDMVRNMSGDKRTRTTVAYNRAQQSHAEIVFPFGSTLHLDKSPRGSDAPIPILHTGALSLPINRPVVAASEIAPFSTSSSTTTRVNPAAKGRLVVVGSAQIAGDNYFNKEKNAQFLSSLIKWLSHDPAINFGSQSMSSSLNQNNRAIGGVSIPGTKISRGLESELYSGTNRGPNTSLLAEELKPCLKEIEPLPRLFTLLHDPGKQMGGVLANRGTQSSATGHNRMMHQVVEVLETYKTLGVEHEPLKLIPPQFDIPLPPLQPALFPPLMREPIPPALELFDLDSQFASEQVQLATLVQQSSGFERPEDIDFMIRRAGDILGVTHHLGTNRTAKDVLAFMVKEIAKYKQQQSYC